MRVESRCPTSCIKLYGGLPSWLRMSRDNYEREFAECKWLSIPQVLGGWQAVCIWLEYLFLLLATDLKNAEQIHYPLFSWVNFSTIPDLFTWADRALFSYFGYCFSVCWEEGGVWKLNWEEWKAEGGLPPPQCIERNILSGRLALQGCPWWGLCLRPREVSLYSIF